MRPQFMERSEHKLLGRFNSAKTKVFAEHEFYEAIYLLASLEVILPKIYVALLHKSKAI
jgi:hypothetical protein